MEALAPHVFLQQDADRNGDKPAAYSNLTRSFVDPVAPVETMVEEHCRKKAGDGEKTESGCME